MFDSLGIVDHFGGDIYPSRWLKHRRCENLGFCHRFGGGQCIRLRRQVGDGGRDSNGLVQ